MKLVLPYPPSANRYWRFDRRHGHMHPSAEATKYKREIEGIVRAQMPRARFPVFSGELSVCMVLFRPRAAGDLDNFFKVAFDSLNGIAWRDDSQVVRIVADREDSRLNPRVEVLIEPRRLAGQQTALELGEAENAAAPLLTSAFDTDIGPRERCVLVPVPKVVSQHRRLSPRELAARARPNVVRNGESR